MEIEIISAKVDKKGHLLVSYSKKDGDRVAEVTENDKKTEVHQDLKNAMNGLAVHYALMTGCLPYPKKLKDISDETLSDFHVSGYSIGGAEDDQGIVITGHRILPNKKATIINTPFYRFDEEQKNAGAHKFMEELQGTITAVEDEIQKFLFENKKAPVAEQTKIPGFAEDTKPIPELAN